MIQGISKKSLIFFGFILSFTIACESDSSATGETKDEAKNDVMEKNTSEEFDWEGHRGARGLMPENTLPSFIVALDKGVKTLEMDVVISQDGKVVISHEPWMNSEICLGPKGAELSEEEGKNFKFYQKSYAEIKQYDCGSKGNKEFPEQKKLRIFKPLMKDIIRASDTYAVRKELSLPQYNIEIKSKPEWDNDYTPVPEEYTKVVLAEIREMAVEDRAIIQSFDIRALQEVKRQNPAIRTAFLTDEAKSLATNIEALGFTPDIYSPHYLLVTEQLVKDAHDKKMKVIPWTVNDTDTMKKLIALGVDGIITDYPDKKPEVF